MAVSPDASNAVASSPLYSPVRSYVERALQHLATRYLENPRGFAALPYSYWQRDADTYFRPSHVYFDWQADIAAELTDLPEHAAALAALKSDPLAAQHLDTLVGHPRMMARLDTEALLRNLINVSFDATSGFQFQSERFDDRFKSFVSWIHSDWVETVTLTPLSGVAGESSGPIVLGDATELDRLTDEEVARALSVGAIRPFGGVPIFANEPPAWGLRVRYPMPKLVGEHALDSPDVSEAVLRADELTHRETERAITVLRLHKEGAFSPVPSLGFTNTPGPGSGTSMTPVTSEFHGFGTYVVSDGDRLGLEQLSRDLASAGVRQRAYVENAARRFSFAADRRRSDDRLLDYMIAAESLFLGHIPEREGELRYRLSIHAAHLLGRTAVERAEIAKQMRRAYDARSAIVHGGSRNLGRKSLAGASTIDELATKTEGLVRRALKRAVSLAAETPGTGPFFDWDAAIYA